MSLTSSQSDSGPMAERHAAPASSGNHDQPDSQAPPERALPVVSAALAGWAAAPQSAPAVGSREAREATERALATVRRFHLTGAGAGSTAGFVPPHLQVLSESGLRRDFPLLLQLPDDAAKAEPGSLLPPMVHTLPELVDVGFAASRVRETSQIMEQVTQRFKAHIRSTAPANGKPVPARQVFENALRRVETEFGLDAGSDDALRAFMQSFVASIPLQCSLLSANRNAYLYVLLHLVRAAHARRRAAFVNEIDSLREGLYSMLLVEESKEKDRAPNGLAHTMGSLGSHYVDSKNLASLLGPWRGGESLSQEVRAKAKEVLRRLESAALPEHVLVLVHDSFTDVKALADDTAWKFVQSSVPCRAASTVFAEEATQLTEVLRTMRLCRLLLERRYDPKRHDAWLDAFDWESFLQDELLLVPTVVAIEDAARLSTVHLDGLSNLLLSGKPIQVLALQQAWLNPAAPSGDFMERYRFELGYFGIGHRKALVQQTSLARPHHFSQGLQRGIEEIQPCLHVVDTGFAPQSRADVGLQDAENVVAEDVDPCLYADLAIESRTHPFFRYNPEVGATWAQRMEFAGNPQAEGDWPLCRVRLTVENGGTQEWNLPFTVADYGLLEPALQSHFMPIPDELVHADLVRIDAYLQMPVEDADHCVPFVWAVDAEQKLRRLALTRKLAMACADRLDYWRTLQELAGIRNQYVETAIERTREADRANAEEERNRLLAAHAEELERQRKQTVRDSMHKLARMLLEFDPLHGLPVTELAQGEVVAPAPAKAPLPVGKDEPPVASGKAVTESAPTAEAAAGPAAAIEEPFIDTPLCTSCNDCMAINSKVFVYDQNKQAYISDAKAATFEQLVRAAEKCPARCIHPGKPLNPNEPNLEALIKRAAPFNV